MGLFGFGGADSAASHIPDCYSTTSVPGRQIVRNLGLVQYTQKGIAGDIPKVSDGIFRALLEQAKGAGGNAVINLRIESGSYHQQGSQWEVTYLIAYGDAVVLG